MNKFPKSNVEELLEKLSDKVDAQHKDVDTRLDNIEKVMIAQEINVKEHMRRSDNLEKMYTDLQEKDIKPLRRHVNMVEGGFKLLGVLSLILGICRLLGFI